MSTVVGVTSENQPQKPIATPTPTPDNNQALANYQNYKKTQQQLNTSSVPSSSNNENTSFASGGANEVPPVITARQVLAQRASESLPSPPASSLKPMPGLVDPGAVKESQAIYQHEKAIGPETPVSLAKSNNSDEPGLVGITSNITTKNGITTIETITPGPPVVNTINGITTTQTEYYRKDDTPLKAGLASFIEPFAFTGLAIESFGASLIGKNLITGENVPFGQGATEQQVQNKLTSVIGPTYLDDILSGKSNTSTLSPGEKVASIIGTGASVIPWLIGGGGAGRAGSGVASRLTLMQTKTVAFKIAGKLQEGTLVSKLQRPEDPLTGLPQTKSNVYEFTQGTTAKSGIDSYTVEKPGLVVQKVEGGKVQAVYPELPPYLKATKTVTSIEQTGTKTIPHNPTETELSKRYPLFGSGPTSEGSTLPPMTDLKPTFGEVTKEVPNVVQLNDNEGLGNKPVSIIGSESTLIMRSEPQNVLPPNEFLVTDITPGRAVHLGLEAVPGMKNTYFGKATPHNVEKINEMMMKTDESGKPQPELAIGTDMFQFTNKDLLKSGDILSFATEKPEVYNSKAFSDIERIYETSSSSKPGTYLEYLRLGDKKNNIIDAKNRIELAVQEGKIPNTEKAQRSIKFMREQENQSTFDLMDLFGVSNKVHQAKIPQIESNSEYSTGYNVQKGTEAGSFAGIPRPNVIRILEGPEPGGYKLKPQKKEIDLSLPSKPMKPLDLSSMSSSKGSAGSFARSVNLVKETIHAKTVNMKPETPAKTETYKPVTSFSKSSSKNITTTEYETLAYPPGNKTGMMSIQKFDLNVGSKSETQTKLEEKLKEKTDQETKLRFMEITKNDQKPLTDTISLTTGRQTTITMTKQTTVPDQTQKQLIITIPKPTGKPPKTTGEFPTIFLPTEEKRKQVLRTQGKVKRIFFSWNVNTEVVGGYLPGQELRVGKTAKGTIGVHARIQKKWNTKIARGGKPVRRSSITKAEKKEKQTFSKIDKSVYKKPEKTRMKKWF